MDDQIELVIDALKRRFKAVVAESAGMPFEETKVAMPHDDIWRGYAVAALAAIAPSGVR